MKLRNVTGKLGENILYTFFVVVFVCVIFPVLPASAQENPESMGMIRNDHLFNASNVDDDTVNRTYPDLLLHYRDTSRKRKGLILNFCDVVLRTRDKVDSENVNLPYYGFDSGQFKYDPRQSLFVYALCVNVDEASKGTQWEGDDYIYRNYKKVYEKVEYPDSLDPVPINVNDFWQEDADLNRLWGIPKQENLDSGSAYSSCNPTGTMQGCNFSGLLPDIFNELMNEYTNIKLASIYGYKIDFSEDKKLLDQAVADFSESYFNDPRVEGGPCNDEEIIYLHDESAEDESEHCSHPETRKIVENLIKSSSKLIKDLKYLNHENIMNPFDDKEKVATLADYCNGITVQKSGGIAKYLLHACSFTTRGDVAFMSDWTTFSNLMLNELMWYSLFADYYGNQIAANLSYQEQAWGSMDFVYRKNLKEVNNLTFEKGLAEQAVYQTRRLLKNITTTLPLYVALEAYREDIVNYRNDLKDLYTPLNQLYYTFRNVQSCNEQGN